MSMIATVPEQFWSLFRSRNREVYMEALCSIYEEYQYNNYFITQEAARQVIDQCLQERRMTLEAEENETEAESIQPPAARLLGRLISTGWLEKLEDYMQGITHIVIPDYAAVFLDAFERLYKEEDDTAEVYIRNVYASVFSYIHDERGDTSLLKGALHNTKVLNKSLQSMLHNMNHFFTGLLEAESYGSLLEEHLYGYVEEVVQKKYHILKTSDNFYRYKNDIKKWLREITERTQNKVFELEWKQVENSAVPAMPQETAAGDGNANGVWQTENSAVPVMPQEMAEGFRKKEALMLEKYRQELKLAEEISRAFDDIEQKIQRMDGEHRRYVTTTVMRLNYLLNEDHDTKGQIIRFLNGISRQPQLQREALEKAANAISFTSLEIMDRERFYRKRKKRSVFQPKDREDTVTEEISREEVLRMNQAHNRYSRQQIEAFLEEKGQGSGFETDGETVKSQEEFEKLILAYDYALRRTSRYGVTVLEEQIETKEYSYPKLRFERKG